MDKISDKELIDLARLSRLELNKDEIPALKQQIGAVLAYAERVVHAVTLSEGEDVSAKSINVFREDVVQDTDSQAIIAQAPVHEENFFVVPSILDNK